MNSDKLLQEKDLLCRTETSLLPWRVPQFLFGAGFFLPAAWRAWVWPIVLTWLGGACLLNAFRCGRLHCFLPGPLYLTGAVLTLLLGQGMISFVRRGWLWLGLGLIVLGNVMVIFPEKTIGQYIWGQEV